MSFPIYPAYKDSGIEWLGALPRHWQVTPLKYIATFAGGGTPSRDVPAYWNGDIPWVSPKDMKDEIIQDSGECITNAGLAAGAASLIAPSAVLMVVRSGILRHTIPVAINETAVALNQDMKALRLDGQRCHPWFLLRLVQGMNSTFLNLWLKQGATVESIEHEYLAATEIPLPPIEEQSAIAAFLDRETGKIDALVSEQERLIALLKEKRQAVISRAVTKGLDPNAPMKDSGVEWLGEVPAHWEVVPLGRRYEVQLGRMLNEDRAQGDNLRPYLRVFDVQWGHINVDDLPMMDFPSDAQQKYLLEAGDLLVNEGGSYVGRSAVWRGEIAECYYQKALHRVRPYDHESDTTAFLYYVMESTTRLGVFVAGGNQTTIDHLTAEKLRAHRFALPPMREQERIAAFLKERIGEVDALTTEAERAIALLKERRAALISAAVTGKIDVRGLVNPEEVQAE